MDARYSLALLGDFPIAIAIAIAIADEIEAAIQERISVLGLELHKDVTLYRGNPRGNPRGFRPKHDRCCSPLRENRCQR
jgi:hypothetical protein